MKLYPLWEKMFDFPRIVSPFLLFRVQFNFLCICNVQLVFVPVCNWRGISSDDSHGCEDFNNQLMGI